MDKDLVKKTLDEITSPTVTITVRDAGGNTHPFTGTVVEHDAGSYESALMLATAERSVTIKYNDIYEITPA